MLKKHIPNILTAFRIVASLIIGCLFYLNWFSALFCVFCLAVITDFFDGFLARRWRVESDLGAILDPCADKLLTSVLTVGVVALCAKPFYVLCVYLGRDLTLLLGGAFLAWKKKLKISVLPLSKVNTCLQFSYILLCLIGYMLQVSNLVFYCVEKFFEYASVATTICSLIMYSWREVRRK